MVYDIRILLLIYIYYRVGTVVYSSYSTYGTVVCPSYSTMLIVRRMVSCLRDLYQIRHIYKIYYTILIHTF